MKPTAEFHIGNFCKVQQMCQCLNPNLKTQRKKNPLMAKILVCHKAKQHISFFNFQFEKIMKLKQLG